MECFPDAIHHSFELATGVCRSYWSPTHSCRLGKFNDNATKRHLGSHGFTVVRQRGSAINLRAVSTVSPPGPSEPHILSTSFQGKQTRWSSKQISHFVVVLKPGAISIYQKSCHRPNFCWPIDPLRELPSCVTGYRWMSRNWMITTSSRTDWIVIFLWTGAASSNTRPQEPIAIRVSESDTLLFLNERSTMDR